MESLETRKMLEDVPEEMSDKPREDEYLEKIRKLQLNLAEKTNLCESLKVKLDQTTNDVDLLSKELNECKLTMFENDENSHKIHEEVMKSKKLEEDYVKLMSQFIELSDETCQYKQNILDNYLAKSNLINNYDCINSSGAYRYESEQCKKELNYRMAELSVALAKVRSFEEDNILKDKTIAELRKIIDDAKITHKHELKVLDEYIMSLKNTITSYEKTLTSYIETKDPSDIDV